jgi:hypothetical protein
MQLMQEGLVDISIRMLQGITGLSAAHTSAHHQVLTKNNTSSSDSIQTCIFSDVC